MTLTGAEKADPVGDPARQVGVPAFWLAAVLLRERRLLGICALLGLLVALLLAFLRPATFTTSFSFVPQTGQDGNRAGLANLAGQFGINLGLGGGGEPPQLYAELLSTRSVLGPVANDSFVVDPGSTERVPLSTFLKVTRGPPDVVTENTIRALRRKVVSSSIAIRTTGMVTVNVRTKSRLVSYAIAERLLAGLNHFNLSTRQSQAREERRFTEGRLADARAALRSAEDALQAFYQTNRQFANSPSLTFRRDRLQREVAFHQQVVTTLAQQYEENRIREVRDTPVITVIEAPVLAARPDQRLRALIIILGTAAGAAIGILLILSRTAWARYTGVERDPAATLLLNEWRRFRSPADRPARQ